MAQYGDASNLFGGPAQLLPKYAILAEHCAAVGRDFAEIERSNLQPVILSAQNAWGSAPESVDQIVERFGRLAEAGVQHVIISTANAHDPAAIELLGRVSCRSSGAWKRQILEVSRPPSARADLSATRPPMGPATHRSSG